MPRTPSASGLSRRSVDPETVWAKLAAYGVTRAAVSAATASAYTVGTGNAGLASAVARVRATGADRYRRAATALEELRQALADDPLNQHTQRTEWTAAVDYTAKLSKLVAAFETSYDELGLDLTDPVQRFPGGPHAHELKTQVGFLRVMSAWITPWETALLLVAGFDSGPVLPSYGKQKGETLRQAVRRVENIVLPQLRRDARKHLARKTR